jgi:lysophospholipase
MNIVRFDPENEKTAVIQIVHGFGEHTGMYQGLAEFFNRNGFACVAHDQQGHGALEEKKLGIVNGYDDFLDDIQTVREKISEWYPSLPVILYGHSMGGNIALNYLIRRRLDEYKGAVIETPWLRLYERQPLALVVLAKILGKFSPNFAIKSKLQTDILSRDPAKAEAVKSDKLYHNRMGLRIFTQLEAAGEHVLQNTAKLTLPVLLLGGEDDRIVCIQAIRELAENAPDNVIYHEEPEGRHVLRDEIEPVKSKILERMLNFCKTAIK